MFAPIWSAVQPPSVHHERWMVVYQSVPLMPSFKAQPQGSSISASKPLSTFDVGEEDEDLVARSQRYGRVRRMEGAYAGGGARGGHWLA
ncbi:hypothetical protein F383_36621 [Gossypium arboreum]|uniref:Uncharacterized protein n=1 Tax=Gossypium arboreum TaxID=29729 RepID=A0A0B0M636_GOSAR|nr:hypothetical protein F383_36621 [Gossypium arboreum]